MRRIVLLVNPSAGGGRAARILPEVERALTAHGVRYLATTTRDMDHAREVARDAALAGEPVVTLSGDGLIGSVAGILRDIPGSVLGALPGGRGNDFCRVAGIPLDPVAACAVIARGEARPVDVGDVDGRTFIGIASLGFDSEANRIANEAPSRLGNLVYAYGALRAVANWEHATFTVRLDGGAPMTFTGWTVAAANSKAYGGGMFMAPDADLHDGRLDVVLCGRTARRRFLLILPKVFAGEHVHEPSYRMHRAREVHVDADRPFTVYADGDPIGRTPATIRAVPDAVRVLLPQPMTDPPTI